ncbi:MAG TPA: hypothetical protein VGA78_13020 [Gemmatimonadales bacterium]
MTEQPDRDPGSSLGRLAQNVDPASAAYERLVSRLRARGEIRRSSMRPWLLIGAGLAAAALVLAVLNRPVLEGPQYLLLLEEPSAFRAATSAAEQTARVTEYSAWAQRLRREDRLVSAGELEPRGSVVGPEGVQAGESITAPTGYFLIRAISLQDAERLAQGSPHIQYGGSVVVRPVVH